jgi:hypothetical protein
LTRLQNRLLSFRASSVLDSSPTGPTLFLPSSLSQSETTSKNRHYLPVLDTSETTYAFTPFLSQWRVCSSAHLACSPPRSLGGRRPVGYPLGSPCRTPKQCDVVVGSIVMSHCYTSRHLIVLHQERSGRHSAGRIPRDRRAAAIDATEGKEPAARCGGLSVLSRA